MVDTKIQNINYLDFPTEIRLRGNQYLKAVDRVLKSANYMLAREVSGFEDEFAKYLGVKYCIGVANGMEAIQISLMALGIKKGDEVITTPISAVATTLAILAVGATPVFADINEFGQIDSNKIEKLINKKTKAILPVDLYGQPCDVIGIKKLCKKFNLFFIEDACQAHGAIYKSKKLGTYGDVGCFSFYPTKNLGTFGDAGAIVTDNKDIAEKFRQIRDYGQESKYVHVVAGMNSRLDEIHAAILRVKLKYLDRDNNIRRKFAKLYVKNLSEIKGLTVVLPNEFDDSNFHLFVIKSKKRDELKRYLSNNGIPTLIHYPLTIPNQPVLKNLKLKFGKLPVSEKFVAEILSIPCHQFLTIREVEYISNKIKDFFAKNK